LGDSVLVPNGTTNALVVGSGSASVGTLMISSGASLTVTGGASLNVYGNLIDSGSILGAGKTVFAGSAAQKISGHGYVTNFTLNNAAGASISSNLDTLTVGDILYSKMDALRQTVA